MNSTRALFYSTLKVKRNANPCDVSIVNCYWEEVEEISLRGILLALGAVPSCTNQPAIDQICVFCDVQKVKHCSFACCSVKEVISPSSFYQLKQ